MDLLGLLGRGIELVEEASLFEDDQLSVGAGELHVEVVELGDLRSGLGLRVIDEDVHGHVTVGGEVDLVSHPHGEYVLGDVVGDFLDLLPVIDPDLVGHSATIVFPCTELPHDPVVGEFPAVRGITAETSFRKRDFLRHPALYGDLPEFPGETVPGPVAVDNIFPVRSPAHDYVVGAHPVSKVVTAIGSGVGETHRLATGGRYQVDFAVAVVFTGEGDHLAIRGIAREHLVTDVRGEPARLASRKRGGKEVTCIGEDYVRAIGGREPQEPRLACRLSGGQDRHSEESKCQEDSLDHNRRNFMQYNKSRP